MNKIVFRSLLVAFVFVGSMSYSQVIRLSGAYQGEDLYITNPILKGGASCIKKVLVNNKFVVGESFSNAIELNLESFNFLLGTPLVIKIIHDKQCEPKVINPKAISLKSTFEIKLMRLSSDTILYWSTTKEICPIQYSVEQYKWNKWVPINIEAGTGYYRFNEYSAKVKAHSGLNKYRVKQIDDSGFPRYSEEITKDYKVEEVEYKQIDDKIIFSGETDYEVYDKYAALMKRGRAKTLDLKGLADGEYFMNYDNKMGFFEIKKKDETK